MSEVMMSDFPDSRVKVSQSEQTPLVSNMAVLRRLIISHHSRHVEENSLTGGTYIAKISPFHTSLDVIRDENGK